jgi:phospholipid-translocating ATPase
MARDFDTVKLNVFGKPALFTVLHTLEFSGERKRMSVIMQDDSGRIMLLTKGADAVVLARTAKDQPLVSADVAQHQADKMGNECLRTLVLAYKELSREQYNDWYNTYWKPSIEDYANRQSIVDKASGTLIVSSSTSIHLQQFLE